MKRLPMPFGAALYVTLGWKCMAVSNHLRVIKKLIRSLPVLVFLWYRSFKCKRLSLKVNIITKNGLKMTGIVFSRCSGHKGQLNWLMMRLPMPLGAPLYVRLG